jgi:hypothetical protein
MKKNYFAVIPAFVRYDEELTPNAKLMYGELTALSNEQGFCFATNKYFADLYGVTTTSISKWINQLKSKNYIKVKMIYKKDSKEIEQRKIYIHSEEKVLKKTYRPMKEMLQDNNNIIYNNNSIENFSDIILKSFNHICELFPVQTRPKTHSDKIKWLECLDKLERLDGCNPRKVYFICQKVRQDEFWKENFLTILKLRKKNRDGLKYINVFEAKFGKDLKKVNI